jgi:hypothetical protein
MGPYGSVRGARGNSRPYREKQTASLTRPGGNEFDRSGDTVEANMTEDRGHVDEVSENLRRSIDALMKSRT